MLTPGLFLVWFIKLQVELSGYDQYPLKNNKRPFSWLWMVLNHSCVRKRFHYVFGHISCYRSITKVLVPKCAETLPVLLILQATTPCLWIQMLLYRSERKTTKTMGQTHSGYFIINNLWKIVFSWQQGLEGENKWQREIKRKIENIQ